MDYGIVGLDNYLVCSNSETAPSNNDKHILYGSGFLKQEESTVVDEDDLRGFKVAKVTCGDSMTKIPFQGCNNNNNQQMLCFSSQNSQMLSFSSHNTSQPVTLPFYHHTAGYGSEGLNAAKMHGVLSGVIGPFTPSQWMELEHQALIYKYITANVPIPSFLLNPIRKALESSGFSCFPGLRPNSLGWGAFHMGFSSTDPEPGRCRRTDGKKWRCSRDAVADQKYCERHMNRGRHRSRKPVEGQTGHSASRTTATNDKLTSTSASVVPVGGASKSLSLLHHHQLNNLHPALSDTTSINRSVLDKESGNGGYQHSKVVSMTSPKMSFKDNHCSIPKHHNAYEESSIPDFGSVSLFNPLNNSSSLANCRSYGTSDNLNDHENKSQHALRHFIAYWPKNDGDMHADRRTKLSISIPITTSHDFMSSTSSPANEEPAASPPRSSWEHEATQMGLGLIQKNNWVPVSWEPSVGGPLGEALHTTSNSTSECKNSKALNLIGNWAFGSVSNSSGGSSPRAESGLCNGLIGPGIMLPSLPAL